MADFHDGEDSEADLLRVMLKNAIDAMGAVAGIVWHTDGSGRVTAATSIGVFATGITESKESQESHERLVRVVFSSPGVQAIPPRARLPWLVGGGSAANPTDLLLLLAPIERRGRRHGLIEICVRPLGKPATESVTQRFERYVGDLARLLQSVLEHRELCDELAAGGLQRTPGSLGLLTCQLHESLDPVATVFALANFGRLIIGCGRLNVLVQRRGRLRLEAISGCETVDRNAPRTCALEAIAHACIDESQALWYPGSSRDVPPGIQQALDTFCDKAGANAIAVLPMERSVPDKIRLPGTDLSAIGQTGRKPTIVGALVAEWGTQIDWDDETRRRVELVAAHGEIALSNAMDYSTWLPRAFRDVATHLIFGRS